MIRFTHIAAGQRHLVVAGVVALLPSHHVSGDGGVCNTNNNAPTTDNHHVAAAGVPVVLTCGADTGHQLGDAQRAGFRRNRAVLTQVDCLHHFSDKGPTTTAVAPAAGCSDILPAATDRADGAERPHVKVIGVVAGTNHSGVAVTTCWGE